jgi:uncharacterized SAM-binding protein YcdF (DUF218 family)
LNELSFSALMPPMCFLIAIPVGAFVAFWWRRVGLTIVLVSSLLLYALCTSFVSTRLLVAAESQVPATVTPAADAQAIVVLGGDVSHGPFGIADGVGTLTLERLHLAASVYRDHRLPILVSGGSETDKGGSLASFMAEVLEHDYGIKPTWIEDKSKNTFQNATYSAAILHANNISRAIIVSQAWHIPRALWAFSQAGIMGIPAPAHPTYLGRGSDLNDFLPDYGSFAKSFYALHELLGLAYYRFHYPPKNTVR